MMRDPIPHDGALWHDGTNPNTIVPAGFATGLYKRDFRTRPQGFMSSAPAFPESELIPESEWPDRWAAKMKYKSSLLHMREDYYASLKSLNQKSFPLCWAFSSTKLQIYLRKLMGLADLELSGWWTAGKAANWRSRGGWGSESINALATVGPCTLAECPEYSSRYDTEDNAAKAKARIITGFWDGPENSLLAQKVAISALLTDRPCVIDLNVMAHSMCCIWFTLNPITFIYDNSWGESGDRGLYKGSGAYARPNGLWIGRQTRAAS